MYLSVRESVVLLCFPFPNIILEMCGYIFVLGRKKKKRAGIVVLTHGVESECLESCGRYICKMNFFFL